MKRILILAIILGIFTGACSSQESTESDTPPEITLEMARQYLSEGNYQEAIETYTALINVDPKNETLFLERANAYTFAQQYSEAIDDYTNVISLNDTNLDAYIYRGVLNLINGDLEKGQQDLKHVSTITNEDNYETVLGAITNYFNDLGIDLIQQDSVDGMERIIYELPDGSHVVIMKLFGQPFGIVVLLPDEAIPESITDSMLTAFKWRNLEEAFYDIAETLEFGSDWMVHMSGNYDNEDRPYMKSEDEYFIGFAGIGLEGTTWDPYGEYLTYPEPNIIVPRGYSEYRVEFVEYEGKEYLLLSGIEFAGGFLFEPFLSDN